MVAGLDLANPLPCLADNTAALVSEAVRQELVNSTQAAGFQELGVADAAEDDFHQRLTWTDGRDIEVRTGFVHDAHTPVYLWGYTSWVRNGPSRPLASES